MALHSMPASLIALLLGSAVVISAVGAFSASSAFAAPGTIDTGVAGATGSAAASLVKGVCNSLALNRGQSSIPRFAGSPATLTYGCGGGGVFPAFVTIQLRSSRLLTLTPIFRVPSGWTLGIAKFKVTGECSPGNVVELSSGSSATLSPNTGYAYCLSTIGATSFSTFSVRWSA